jgi:hypothetical protein
MRYWITDDTVYQGGDLAYAEVQGLGAPIQDVTEEEFLAHRQLEQKFWSDCAVSDEADHEADDYYWDQSGLLRTSVIRHSGLRRGMIYQMIYKDQSLGFSITLA